MLPLTSKSMEKHCVQLTRTNKTRLMMDKQLVVPPLMPQKVGIIDTVLCLCSRLMIFIILPPSPGDTVEVVVTNYNFSCFNSVPVLN